MTVYWWYNVKKLEVLLDIPNELLLNCRGLRTKTLGCTGIANHIYYILVFTYREIQ